MVTSSPDPTPERDAILQAGLSALLRAKDTPVQTPVVCFTLPFTARFNTANNIFRLQIIRYCFFLWCSLLYSGHGGHGGLLVRPWDYCN